MPETDLVDLLHRNRSHTEDMEPGRFDNLQDGQQPAAVSMCCSDSRVSQEGMFAVTEPGWLFTPSTIGNRVWVEHDGEKVVDGSVLYPLVETGTDIAVVVGHTGCGAVTAALEKVQGDTEEMPPGIANSIGPLETVIESGLTDERIERDAESGLVDQLVEYNVDRQVNFLVGSSEVPDSVTVYGFVYDFHGSYGEVPGRVYLVNVDGEIDLATVDDPLPERFNVHVDRLL